MLFDFGLDRVTSHHYFIRLGAVPLAVVMNRKKFESLPKAAQDAIRNHSLDWINKLYIDSMLVYDKALVDRLKGGSEAHRRVSRRRRPAGGAGGVRAGDQGLGRQEPAQRRDVQGDGRRNRKVRARQK